jgi:hypothetical protein
MRTRKRIAFTLAAVLVSFSVQQAAALEAGTTDSPTSFLIVVNASGPGIEAICKQGCAWEKVSATYPGGRYRITEQGIQSVLGDVQSAPEHSESGGFSVVLSTSGEGISAACAEGCAWKTVSATYPTSTYRITEHGIAPAR